MSKEKKEKKPRSKAAKVIRGVVITLGCVILAVVILAVAGGWMLYGDMISALGSISQPYADKDCPVYYMEYSGDYGFDGLLKQGGIESDGEIADYFVSFISHGFASASDYGIEPSDYGCSAIAVSNGGDGYIFGRNFDWDDDTYEMVVVTRPDSGYESISTVNLAFLGYTADYMPTDMESKALALAAPYVPLDGINEKGLFVSDLMVNQGKPTAQDTDKPDLTTTTAIRLLLDKAATVDEAVELLEQYDMHSSVGSCHHLIVADQTGRSVVVEWPDDVMTVTESPYVTNGYVYDPKLAVSTGGSSSIGRYKTLRDSYDSRNGSMTPAQLLMTMKSVSHSTCWTVIFDPAGMTADYYFDADYENKFSFALGE